MSHSHYFIFVYQVANCKLPLKARFAVVSIKKNSIKFSLLSIIILILIIIITNIIMIIVIIIINSINCINADVLNNPKSFNHNKYLEQNVWSYVKDIFKKKDAVLLSFNMTDCLSYFSKSLANLFVIPSGIPKLSTPEVKFNLDSPS